MPQSNFVKICPDCLSANNVNTMRCIKCGKNMAGVSTVPLTLDEPLPEDTVVVKIPESDLESRPTLPLNEPSPVKASRTAFVTRIPRMRTSLKRKRGWFAIAVLLLILLLVLVVFLPRIPRENGKLLTVTPTVSPIHTPDPLHLPVGFGEIITPDGQNIGVNDGSFAPFDIGGSTQTIKQQAATALKGGDVQGAIALWQQALSVKSNDAETLIYLEDQRVLAFGEPHVTLVAGTAFNPPFPDSQYETELQGIYVAQHEFNASNHGFLVRILIANSGSNVNDTAVVAGQVVQITHQDPTIVGIVGWLNSSNTADALSTFANAKIPIISPQASSDALTGISPYFFRVVAPNKVQAQAAALFARTFLHIKNPVVFIDPKELYSENLARDFENTFAAGGHLPEETFVTDHTKSFSSLIQDALKKYHPDAFYFTSSSSADAGLFQDALPTTGTYANIPAIAGDGGYTIHKNGYDRWYFTEYAYHGESNIPIAEQFAQEYISDFDPGPHPQKLGGFYGYSLPDDHAILAYDATSVALTALAMADAHGKTALTSQVLANTLPTITGAKAFQGVSGQIAFGSDHDPAHKAIVILFASKDGHTQLYGIQGCFLKGCH